MTHQRENPLHLEPPAIRADAALGERLALLARASTPTPVRRRAAWRAPLAGLVIVVGTGGLAYGAQSVAHHLESPAVVVPGNDLSPEASASARASSEAPSDELRSTDPTTVGGVPSDEDGPGLHVGKDHAGGADGAPGRAGTAPGQQRTKQRGKSATAPGRTGQQPSASRTPGPSKKGASTAKKKPKSSHGRGHGG